MSEELSVDVRGSKGSLSPQGIWMIGKGTPGDKRNGIG